MFLDTIETPGLAHLSYVIGDASAGVAAVVDPRRDIGVYLDVARRRQVRITDALETHIHADFVSGARALAEATGAEIGVGGRGEYGFEHRPLSEGDVVDLGHVRLRVLETPGHTPEHLCFVVSGGKRADAPWGVFTGDTLFAGSVGRPDLLGEAHTQGLARALFRSLREKLLSLPDGMQVLPGHGAGSPCGATIGDRNSSTIGYEREHNRLLGIADEDAFVREVLQTAPPAPTYYPRMKRVNARGPDPAPRPGRPPALMPDAFEARMRDGALVVDLREIEAWAGAHIPGSLNIPFRSDFPVWAGWMLDEDVEILLVLRGPDDLVPALRHLFRIGQDRVVGWLRNGFRGWSESARDFASSRPLSVQEVRDRLDRGDGLQLLDVRSPGEWGEGRIPGARNVFVPELRGDDVGLDRDRPVAVYCSSGYRAGVGASVLERQGFRQVHNVPGSIGAWKRAGYPLDG